MAAAVHRVDAPAAATLARCHAAIHAGPIWLTVRLRAKLVARALVSQAAKPAATDVANTVTPRRSCLKCNAYAECIGIIYLNNGRSYQRTPVGVAGR